jgi:dihydrofolate reductase
MTLKIIVAKDERGGIGVNNVIPWRIREDLMRFVTLTRGNGKNAVLMGRNTWESLPTNPLVGRHNLVLSNSAFEFSDASVADYDPGRITFFKNIHAVLEYIKDKSYEDVWVIGGEKVYDAFLNDHELNKLVSQVYVTEVAGDYKCDTFFRDLPSSQYTEVSCECVGEKMKFKIYVNKRFLF